MAPRITRGSSVALYSGRTAPCTAETRSSPWSLRGRDGRFNRYPRHSIRGRRTVFLGRAGPARHQGSARSGYVDPGPQNFRCGLPRYRRQRLAGPVWTIPHRKPWRFLEIPRRTLGWADSSSKWNRQWRFGVSDPRTGQDLMSRSNSRYFTRSAVNTVNGSSRLPVLDDSSSPFFLKKVGSSEEFVGKIWSR